MKIKDEDAKRIICDINSKAPDGITCPICKGKDWSLSDRIFQIGEYSGESVVLNGGVVMPALLLTCTNCGYIFSINAIKQGLLNDGTEDKQ